MAVRTGYYLSRRETDEVNYSRRAHRVSPHPRGDDSVASSAPAPNTSGAVIVTFPASEQAAGSREKAAELLAA